MDDIASQRGVATTGHLLDGRYISVVLCALNKMECLRMAPIPRNLRAVGSWKQAPEDVWVVALAFDGNQLARVFLMV
jgi:hypothetical protein